MSDLLASYVIEYHSTAYSTRTGILDQVPTIASRREALLDGLVDLFLAEGVAQLTLADIAARLRCSKSTLYALGPSKEQLVAAAVRRFFRTAAEEVEQRVVAHRRASDRLAVYLGAVADALRPASDAFMRDVVRHPSGAEVYRRNTELAAGRVGDLIRDGVKQREFREVHAAFIADVIASTMERIQSGEIARATGMSDAEAYDELAALVVHGLRT
jgi:AcrR family transcriptional regulator